MTGNRVEMVSRRRAFSLLALAAALGSAVPATLLALSDAEAQTAGMERRQGRRTGRQDRRTGRQERRTGGSQPASAGSPETK